MRHSNHAARGRRGPSLAVGCLALLAVTMLTACGPAAAQSAPPTPSPTPSPTPDPHLREPVTADQVFRALASGKTGIVANNANSGSGNKAIVKQINADIGNWPLRITEYTSSATRAKALAWKGATPVRNQAPYAFAGLNVVVEFGPISTARVPVAPDPTRQKLAESIVAVLDPLLWPLVQHSVVAIPARSAVPASSAPAPSKAPSKAP
jgi:hypothetical protein